MVVAEAVEQAVHREQTQLAGDRAGRLRRGALHRDGDVADIAVLSGGEGEDVGGRVDAHELEVEPAELGVASEAEGQPGTVANTQRGPAGAQQGTEARGPNRIAALSAQLRGDDNGDSQPALIRRLRAATSLRLRRTEGFS